MQKKATIIATSDSSQPCQSCHWHVSKELNEAYERNLEAEDFFSCHIPSVAALKVLRVIIDHPSTAKPLLLLKAS